MHVAVKKCRRKDKCYGFCVRVEDGVGHSERTKCWSVFFFLPFLTEPVKNTFKTLSSRLLLSSVLLPCSPHFLYTSSILDLHTHSFARVSSFLLHPGALIIGPLISAKTLPFQLARLGLSTFSCFPAVCPFPLSSRCFILLLLCCTQSCGQLGGECIDLASCCVSHRAIWRSAYAAVAGRSRKVDRPSVFCLWVCRSWLLYGWIKYCMQIKKDALLYMYYHVAFLQAEQGRKWGRLNP